MYAHDSLTTTALMEAESGLIRSCNLSCRRAMRMEEPRSTLSMDGYIHTTQSRVGFVYAWVEDIVALITQKAVSAP